MSTLQHTAKRIGLAWTPGHTAIAIVVVALAAGFLPFVKMGLVVNGIFLGAIIALGAVGLTLIYGILNFANVAHGDYMTLGAYLALFMVGSVLSALGIEGQGLGPFTFGYPLLLALPVAVAGGGGRGYRAGPGHLPPAPGSGRISRGAGDGLPGRGYRAAGPGADYLGRRDAALSAGVSGGHPPAHGRARSPGRHLHRHRDRSSWSSACTSC